MASDLYPKSPELDSYKFLRPSSSFRKGVARTVGAILFFILFYLFLVMVTMGIMVASIYGGVAILQTTLSAWAILGAVALMLSGILIFVFMIRVVFMRVKTENVGLVRISEKNHPELFKMIDQLTYEIGTSFPKNIYLTADVNASVAFDSTFWSMFFPVKRNLVIGMGLVNSFNISELKAVLAHEFGHFSQRSTRLSNYVYTVNQVIHSLLFEQSGWDNTVDMMRGKDFSFAIFELAAGLTEGFARVIRSLLRGVYGIVMKNYLKLSREMEYHADLVAVSVSGNKAFQSALNKSQFSGIAFELTSQYVGEFAPQKLRTENLFRDHALIIQKLASFNKVEYGLGEFDKMGPADMVRSRIFLEDQWASHPTNEQRIANLNKVDIEAEFSTRPAWDLFKNAKTLQKKITELLYRKSFEGGNWELIDEEEIEELVASRLNDPGYPAHYHEFYEVLELKEEELSALSDTDDTFEDIFSSENVYLIKRYYQNLIDASILEQISEGYMRTKQFEFDGEKYKWKEAEKVLSELRVEIEQQLRERDPLVQRSISYFLKRARRKGDEDNFVKLYQEYCIQRGAAQGFQEVANAYHNLSNGWAARGQITQDMVPVISGDFGLVEQMFKEALKKYPVSDLVNRFTDQQLKNKLKHYIKRNPVWFDGKTFSNANHQDMMQMIGVMSELAQQQFQVGKKTFLDYQLELNEG